MLARYGTEAEPARRDLRQSVGEAVGFVWSGHEPSQSLSGSGRALKTSDRLYDAIAALPDGDPHKAALRDQALGQLAVMQHSGLKLSRFAQARPQTPMLAIVLSWLVIIFVGFGLVSPQTGTARVSILLAAVAVSGALFLIVELYSPVSGMLRIPPSILEGALAPVGRSDDASLPQAATDRQPMRRIAAMKLLSMRGLRSLATLALVVGLAPGCALVGPSTLRRAAPSTTKSSPSRKLSRRC